jgi:hypothetical protein
VAYPANSGLPTLQNYVSQPLIINLLLSMHVKRRGKFRVYFSIFLKKILVSEKEVKHKNSIYRAFRRQSHSTQWYILRCEDCNKPLK